MRTLFLGLLAACIMATSAAAQDAGREHRLALADQYLTLTFGADFQHAMEEQLKTAYGETELEPAQRSWLTSHMMAAIQSILPDLIVSIRGEAADLYTAEELDAMIAFQSTPVGRSASAKGIRMSTVIARAMQAPLTEAVSGLTVKYCAAFECPAAASAPAKAQ